MAAHLSFSSLPLPSAASPSLHREALRPRGGRRTTKHPQFELLKHRLIRQAEGGRLGDALSTLDLMAELRAPADLVAYSVLLKACIRSRDLACGRAVHRRLRESGLEPDIVVVNSLLTLYSKCGDWKTADSIFLGLGERRDLVSWTSMISGCANTGAMRSRAIRLFCEMLARGIRPNEFCFSSVLRACSRADYFHVGLAVFAFSIKASYFNSDICVGCALVDLFAKNSEMISARKVFDAMTERNAVAWTQMITRYLQHGSAEDAIDLFLKMESEGFRPDQFTLSSAISASTGLGSIRLGQQLHGRVVRQGLAEDVCVGCSLVDMYAKTSAEGAVEDSKKVFDRMVQHNVMSWTAIISGLAQRRRDGEAVDLFCQMVEGSNVRPNFITFSGVLKACANIPDLAAGEQIYALVVKSGMASVNCVGSSIISMYANSGKMEEARKAFEGLLDKNLISCNASIHGNAKNPDEEDKIQLNVEGNNTEIGASAFSFASLLSGAASIGAASRGKQLHAWLLKAGFYSDQSVANALVSMYSKCGDVDDAHQVFDEMTCRNVISWTSMIVGLAKHGYAERAINMFHEMVLQHNKPNEVAYIAVLSACSHAGMVTEGREHFRTMSSKHGIVPRMEHYACMVDLLGRSGYLEEAASFIRSMPFEANASVWRALLGACRVHGDTALGEKAAKHVMELEPNDPSAYVLLSNIYAARGQWQSVVEIRRGMKEKKLMKEAGLSWVEIENNIHEFHVGDTRHRHSREIYTKLNELMIEIKQMGYAPDLNFVLHDVRDELKEQYLFQHSEKIAVAFGLISTSAPKPVKIFKNLRVCGDCHAAIKFISKATGRRIILRDSNRFHCFEDGACSCREYW